jgi:GNAT superfamily N-acetyltransferase
VAVEIREVKGWDDLQRWVAVRNEAAPDSLTAEMRSLVRALELEYVDLLALEAGEPVGAAFISGDPSSTAGRRPWFDLRVPERARGRGVGSALLEAIEYHALRLGHEALKTAVRESDAPARRFLESRGFAESGGWEQLSLELGGELPDAQLLPGPGIASLDDRPALLSAMYRAAVELGADLRGKAGDVPFSEAQWRAYELGSSLVRLDLTLLAVEGDEVRGYSVLQDFEGHDVLYHRGLVGDGETAAALVAEQARRAAAAGMEALVVVPRTERLHALFRRLGYEPRRRWLHYERVL